MDETQGTAKHVDPFVLATWPPHLSTHWYLSRTINGIKHELQVVLGRVEAVDYMGNQEDVQIVSGLVDQIRDAFSDYQVSLDPK